MPQLGVYGVMGEYNNPNILSSPLGYFIPPVDFSLNETQLMWRRVKDPEDKEWFAVDFTKCLAGDAISSAIFEVTQESGLTVSPAEINGNIISALLSDGAQGGHRVTVTVTTDSGRVKQRDIKLKVKNI